MLQLSVGSVGPIIQWESCTAVVFHRWYLESKLCPCWVLEREKSVFGLIPFTCFCFTLSALSLAAQPVGDVVVCRAVCELFCDFSLIAVL